MRLPIILLFTLVNSIAYAQHSRYIIEFRSKEATTYSLNNPSTFLSESTIERRNRFNIAIDSTDLPVPNSYIDSIRIAGNVEIINTSKWLNQVLIKTNDAAALEKIRNFPFVKNQFAIAQKAIKSKESGRLNIGRPIKKEKSIETLQNLSSLNYGYAGPQITIHEGEYLHNKGFQGAGIKIAVLDAGFYKYQNIAAFDSLRLNNRILDTWDFVQQNSSVNEDDAHGMWCLSILAANMPGTFVGSAPEASYYLYRTEEVATEFPVEEQNWASAAEQADSLGVDIITSSLGYNQFDDTVFNHTYSDMNGRNTMITRAAAFAINKGIIVTNSAGNDGAKKWKYIVAPADGIDVLTVGAINILQKVAPFSSYGPSSDGRVKPDVTSVGWNTYLISTTGEVGRGSGTSFSNPNIAGLTACLWQAFPTLSNKEIINAIRQSSDHYTNPDDRVGYGIPNMHKAYTILEVIQQSKELKKNLKNDRLKIFPNPISNQFNIFYKSDLAGKVNFQLIDLSGKLIRTNSFELVKDSYQLFLIDNLSSLSPGEYILRYNDGVNSGNIKLLK
jgi:hypothetical protein